MKTLFGGIITFVVLSLTLAYAILKGIHLLTKKNPTINVSTIPSFIDISDTVNFNDINFRLAFSIRSDITKELIDDHRYVKWIVRRRGVRDGEAFEEMLPFHKCTDADYEEFYPVAKKSQGELKMIKTNPKKNLFCLDKWTDDLFVGGDRALAKDFQRFEVMLLPCNYIHISKNKTA